MMRKLVMALVMMTVISCAGFGVWKAQAMVLAGAAQLTTPVKSSNPVIPAACGGNGAHCPPGYNWNGNRCVPC
jgi:hypothetical protein